MSLVQQADLVNSQNSHFSNPGFSSKVGAASGCGGSVTSPDALNQSGMYEVMKIGGAKKCPKSCKCNCHNCYCRGKCSGKCSCPCHKKCPGNCGCGCHKCMSCGKRHRKGCPMMGGNGYGFSKSQSLAPTSGVNSVNGSVHLAGFTGYQNKGINSDTNMGASSQSGGSGYGSGGIPYYSYNPSQGENLSTFAGSGYPPISRELNNQCITPPILVQGGGKKRKSRKSKKGRRGKKGKKGKKITRKKRGAGVEERSNSLETVDLDYPPPPPHNSPIVSRNSSVSSLSRQTSTESTNSFDPRYYDPNVARISAGDDDDDDDDDDIPTVVSVRQRANTIGRQRANTIGGKYKKKGKKTRKRRGQKGGYSQYMSNIANSHIYSTGAPPSLSYTESMLANPPPYTPKNDCMNSWKHLGDSPPYNEVYM